jgi:conjugative transfer ATPase
MSISETLSLDGLTNAAKYALLKLRNPQVARAITESDVENLYKRSKKSFIDFLPFVDYDEGSRAFLLEDGLSVAAVYTVTPIPTEGRSPEMLIEFREKLQQLYQNSFVNADTPWVVQEYSYADKRLGMVRNAIAEHVAPHAKGTEFTNHYLNTMEKHYQGIADNEAGIFVDTEVTQEPFRGQLRRCKLIFYRRINASEAKKSEFDAVEDLNETAKVFEANCKASGLQVKRDEGSDFFNWILDWFNPDPAYYDKKSDFLREMAYPDEEERPYGFDLAENLVFDDSVSDPENKCWHLNEKPMRFIRARSIRQAPKIGQLSGELEISDGHTSCLLDKLPEGSVVAKTMVIQSQSEIEMHVDRMIGKSHGDTNEVARNQKEIANIKDGLGGNQHIVKASFGVYVRGDNIKHLRSVSKEVVSTLQTNGIVCYPPDRDTLSCNAFLVHLPMAFEAKYDAKHKYLKHFYMQHMVNLSLMYGRSEGTGNQVINFFNRGGSPMSYDFLDKDRKSNSHKLIVGPTGSGKSATMCYLAAQMMAAIRPRMFIFELGNSFGLLGDYFKELGLSVVKKQLKPGAGVSLNPFSDSKRIIEDDKARRDAMNRINLEDLEADHEEDDHNELLEDDQRDVMGEMLSAALLMITGGEKKEYEALNRADRGLVNTAIREAAQRCYDEGKEMITSDLRDQLRIIGNSETTEFFTGQMKEKAILMAASIDTYCHEFDGEMFNTPGGSWEDADVTIIDLATYAKEGYEAQMALTYISLMNHVNALGEKTQHQDRKIIQMTDEAHVVTKSPMLAPFLVKAVKVQRKIGISSILATQNLSDFTDDSAKLLNMIDWWMILCPTMDEVEQVSRFKPLSEERKVMMASARKQKRAYTEGVVLASGSMAPLLFRNVPPSLYLALGLTEKEEKAERRSLMGEHSCSEYHAACMVADKMDVFRGIKNAV